MKIFDNSNIELTRFIQQWTPLLLNLDENIIVENRNIQNRNIRQIVGHMIDSASNNTHRLIHLQYQTNPVNFPNYATNGNNDRWISIQNYENENWSNLIQLWKYIHLHFIHVCNNIDETMLDKLWNAGNNETVSLKEMALDFNRHFKLHITEIEELMHTKQKAI